MKKKKKPPHPEKVVVTRYYTPDGRRAKKSTPGAAPRTESSDTYFVRLPDPKTGERAWHSLETCDEGEAWRELGRLLQRREREAAGIRDPMLAHAAKPLADHVTDWIADLKNEGKTGDAQLALLESRVRRLAGLAGWSRLTDVDGRTCRAALAKLQAERSRGMAEGHAGRGNRTRNHYLRHAKQFVAWAVADGRLPPPSPLAGVKTVNPAVDVRRARRAPSTEEVALLMAYLEGEGAGAAAAAAVRCDMTGPQRGLGYRVCMATGFRAKELRLLQPVSFDLDAGTVTCRAAYGKNRRVAVQQLPGWLVEELRAWLAEGKPLWGRPPRNWPGRLLNEDQAACGIEHVKETAKGKEYFDFHSLRHWYCTWAANRPGISPKTLQAMARHADPRLTLDVYAKPLEQEIRRQVDQLPDLRHRG